MSDITEKIIEEFRKEFKTSEDYKDNYTTYDPDELEAFLKKVIKDVREETLREVEEIICKCLCHESTEYSHEEEPLEFEDKCCGDENKLKGAR